MNFSNLILIFCCFVLGMTLRRMKVMPEDGPAVLNRFVIYISLPALTMNLIHDLRLSGNVIFPVLMPWILFAVAALLLLPLCRSLGWDRRTYGALVLTAGLGNTSFLGFPFIEAFYGKQALSIGILTAQPGSFLVVSTVGILLASLCAGQGVNIGQVSRRIFLFPPFLATLVAFFLRPIPYPAPIHEVFESLGATMVPLALVSVGMQLRLNASHLREEGKRLGLGLLYKLFLGPLFIAFLYYVVFRRSGEAIDISVFQAAMAPMVTGGIIAAEYDLNARLASMMIGIGVPLSLLVVPGWWWWLSR